MTGKTAIWEALGKTDPAHTKNFNRAGGFKGTALKPMWAIKRLTEHFGPCGVGWGMGEPSFQVVPCGNETLVFCTVSAWHGDRDSVVWGVGGDKVVAARSSGAFTDDEAFKKAFTDAVMNAFKFVGVGADIHMGLFDDSKYVEQAREAFSEPQEQSAAVVAAEVAIGLCKSVADLEQWAADNKAMLDTLPKDQTAAIRKLYATRLNTFPKPEKDAA
jgi:hypothetical protein